MNPYEPPKSEPLPPPPSPPPHDLGDVKLWLAIAGMGLAPFFFMSAWSRDSWTPFAVGFLLTYAGLRGAWKLWKQHK